MYIIFIHIQFCKLSSFSIQWVNLDMLILISIPGLPRSGKKRVAMVREKYLENNFFPRSGKFRKDLENQGKVREFENKWLWQAVVRKFIYSAQEGKGCTLS